MEWKKPLNDSFSFRVRQLFLTVGAILFCAGTLPAQDCYSRFFTEGKAAYEALDFETAIKKFEAAKICPDRPRRSMEPEEWLSKAQNGYILEIKKARNEAQSNALAAHSVLALQLEKQPEKAFQLAEAANRLDSSNAEAAHMLLQSFYQGSFHLGDRAYMNFSPTRVWDSLPTLGSENYFLEQFLDYSFNSEDCGDLVSSARFSIDMDFYIAQRCYTQAYPQAKYALKVSGFGHLHDAVGFAHAISLVNTSTQSQELIYLKEGQGEGQTNFPLLHTRLPRVAFQLEDTLRVWDWAKGKQILAISLKNEPFMAMAFSPEDSLIATLSAGGLVRIWAGERMVSAFNVPGTYATRLGFSPDGEWLYTYSEEGAWGKQWRKHPLASVKGRYLATLPGDSSWVMEYDEKIAIYHPQRGISSWVEGFYREHDPEGKILVLAYGNMRDSTVLWNRSGQTQRTLSGTFVALSPDGKSIILENGQYDWKGKILRGWEHRALAVTSQGEVLFQKDEEGWLLDLTSGQIRREIPTMDYFTWFAGKPSPDGRYLLLSGSYAQIGIWDRDPRAFHSLDAQYYSSSTEEQHFSKDEAYLVIQDSPFQSSSDQLVITSLKTDSSYNLPGLLLDMAADASEILIRKAGPQTQLAALYDLQNGGIQVLQGHDGNLMNGCFSPSGRQLATLSIGGMLKLWNRRGEELFSLQLPWSNYYYDVAFSADERSLLVSTLLFTLSLPLDADLLKTRAHEMGIPPLPDDFR